jgi:hypothetical protein
MVLAGVLSTVLAAVGCGTGKQDRRAAEELAERLYPGRLTVVAVRTLAPASSGSEVTFALAGDADAVVRLPIDSAARTCDGQPCEQRLTRAIEEARTRAETWRLLSGTFERCGHPVIGVDEALEDPWIAAAPTNATVRALLAELGDCVRRFAQARDRRDVKKPDYISIHMAAPEVARGRPAGDRELPGLLRMTDRRLMIALAARPYLIASYKAPPGQTSVPPASVTFQRPYADEQAFEKKIRNAVAARLRSEFPQARVAHVGGLWRVEPGTVDRLTGHALFCDPAPEGTLRDSARADRRCQDNADHAVIVTADPQGNLVGRFRVLRDVRDEQGRVRLPTD